MKSGKQRRQEIKNKRRLKAQSLKVDTYSAFSATKLSSIGAVEADHSELLHNNTYSPLPNFYVDIAFSCQDCGSEEIWTAKQQKWWYEIAKGNINSTAIRCRRCRAYIQAEKEQQKRHMKEIALMSPHPNESFFKKT